MIKVKSGKRNRDRVNGSFAFRTTILVNKKRRAARMAAIAGVINHAKIIDTTPPGKGEPGPGGAVHMIEPGPAQIIDIPMMAPTME